MQQIITLLHILVSICIIALVLVQRGKGAEAGAGFGSGASGTMFGSQGSTPFLVKFTGGLGMVFFITSAVLSFIVGKEIEQRNPVPIPSTQQEIPTSINTGHSPIQQQTNNGPATQSPIPASSDKMKH